MRSFECRQARWAQRLVGGRHGAALAAEIEAEYHRRRQIRGLARRQLAVWALWSELSPRLLRFAGQQARIASPRAPRTGGLMDSFAFMLRSALRSLTRRPGFTALVVVTLALGIGANTAVFSIVNGVLLEPLPYPEADLLVTVMGAPREPSGPRRLMSYPDLEDVRDQAPSIERLAGYSATTTTLTGLGDAELLTAARVSDGLLAIFGLVPVIGRDVRADEFGADAAAVAVISHRFWQQRMGGAADAVGEMLMLNGQLFEIVGVAPEGFDYPSGTDLWYPREIDTGACARLCHTWETIGRLAPGATLSAARVEADGVARNLDVAYPSSNLGKRFAVTSLREVTVGDVRVGLWVLLGAVGAVLLITCANVANLMLARATSRRGEIAVRAALGATPRRLVGSLLIESSLLAVLGGVAGLLLAGMGMNVLRALSVDNLPRVETIGIDASVLLFTFALTVFVALLFATVPSLQLARAPLWGSLGAAARGSDTTVGSRRARSLLTAAEVAISVVLLIGAGLLLRTFFQLYAVDPGFETRQVVRFTIVLPQARYPELEQLRTTFRALEDNIAALPGVESVGSIYGAPMDGTESAGIVIIEGEERRPPGMENGAAIRPVGPGYLETVRIPLVAGRPLEVSDDTSERNVAVVNETFVRENFPDRDPIGERVRITVDFDYGSPFWEIVGVVGDVRSSSLRRIPRAEVYVPHGRFGSHYMNINVRSAVDPSGLLDAIRSAVRAIDPDLPLQRIETLEEVVDRNVRSTRFFLVGVGMFAALATLLAAVGLYGVMAYLVSQRSREIGVRVALGADSGRILRMVLADGLRPTAIGLAVGMLLGIAGGRAIESLLFGVDARDPMILLSVPALLTVIAFAAILTPALRASRVDPLKTLRAD